MMLEMLKMTLSMPRVIVEQNGAGRSVYEQTLSEQQHKYWSGGIP
jgi:hypothetical protein